MKKKLSANLNALAPLLYLVVAVLVVAFVAVSGKYPTGNDVMYHIYRGDWLYHSIQEGNWWPLLNPMWYNGVELLRYWAPLPAYAMALCQFLAGGSTMYAYLVFVGIVCFLGALPWYFMGRREGRPWLGSFLGLLWFFIPTNLYVMFVDGNLARSFSMIFLPITVYGFYVYLRDGKGRDLFLFSAGFIPLLLCHLGFGGMVVLALLLYLLLDKFISRRKGRALNLMKAMALSFLVLSIWTVPSLVGGITSRDTSEVMALFFQPLSASLDSATRFGQHYFGLAAFALALFGILFGLQNSKTGFWAGLTLLLCSTTAMYPVMKILPGGQFLWMLRFFSIALCLILMSFFFWRELRPAFAWIICLLLVADSLPSLALIRGNHDGALPETRIEETGKKTRIPQAQALTGQRIALVDFGRLTNAAWQAVAWGDPTPCTAGIGWEAAVTGSNISYLEQAVLGGNFYYLFDRCKELGADTVLLNTVATVYEGNVYSEEKKTALDQAAEEVGYTFIEEEGYSLLYHMDTPDSWGTVTCYRALGIGVGASTLAFHFPALEEGEVDDLSAYTYEELSQYDLIYLSTFTYQNRQEAEDLLLRLSENGTRVVIRVDGIPRDPVTVSNTFLGVTANQVSFSNGYPKLETIHGEFYPDLFPQGYTEWDTVYAEGLERVYGAVEGDTPLPFYGTAGNDNILFVGLNLPHFLSLTGDRSAEELLGQALGLSPHELPQRRIVPLEIEYSKNSITVVSPEDGVNTALAYHDIFRSDRRLERKNNLTVVEQGTTVIQMVYPYFWAVLAVSLAGLSLTLWEVFGRKKAAGRREDGEEEAP